MFSASGVRELKRMRDKVLVIDDDPVELHLLETRLAKEGYEVLTAEYGERGLELLAAVRKLHVAIVDWKLPGISGVEFCRRVRSAPNPFAIYIIFHTSMDARRDIVTALDSGADDYTVKPTDFDELAARINVGRRVVALQRKLRMERLLAQRYAGRMERLAEARAEQLVHADRLATLGTLSAGVAHEINNPTTFINGNAQNLEIFWPHLRRLVEAAPPGAPDHEQLEFIRDEMDGVIRGIKEGAQRISRIVNGLKTFARQDKSQKIPCDVNGILESALSLCANALKYKMKVTRNFQTCLPEISGNAQQLGQVFINLFTNAADAIGDGKGNLLVTTETVDDWIRITVEDDGPGIPPQVLSKIWSPFFTTKPPGKGTGLGLSISQGIVADHGGGITAENRKEGGACFHILLPARR